MGQKNDSHKRGVGASGGEAPDVAEEPAAAAEEPADERLRDYFVPGEASGLAARTVLGCIPEHDVWWATPAIERARHVRDVTIATNGTCVIAAGFRPRYAGLSPDQKSALETEINAFAVLVSQHLLANHPLPGVDLPMGQFVELRRQVTNRTLSRLSVRFWVDTAIGYSVRLNGTWNYVMVILDDTLIAVPEGARGPRVFDHAGGGAAE